MGAGPQTFFGVDVLVVHGEHQQAEIGQQVLELGEQGGARGAAQRQVDDDQIGAQLAGQLQGIVLVAGLPADGQVRLLAQHGGDASAHYRMIIDDEDFAGLDLGLYQGIHGWLVMLGALIARGSPASGRA